MKNQSKSISLVLFVLLVLISSSSSAAAALRRSFAGLSVKHAATVRRVDKDGRTALMLAIIQEAPFEKIKKILASDAAHTIRHKDKHGFDAYVYALNYAPGRTTLARTLYAVETALPLVGNKTELSSKIEDEKTVLQMILDDADLNDE